MRIAVFGLGLLGGSICKSLRTVDRGGRIAAYDVDTVSLDAAIKESVIDEVIDYGKAAIDCDVAIVALPVKRSVTVIRSVLDKTDDDSLVIDLGSVKTGVIRGVIDHRSSFRFVPCHPMAGSERSGFAGASADILPGASVIITPHEKNDPGMVDRAKRLWEKLGTNVTVTDSVTHDKAVALTSHLPHLISSAIVHAERKGSPENVSMAPFRGKGYRDMTRLASGAPSVWEDICEMNAEQIIVALDLMTDALAGLRGALDGNGVDMKAVHEFLEQAAEMKKEI